MDRRLLMGGGRIWRLDFIIYCTHLSYHCPRYIAFIDLTKAFNLVIRKGLFILLQTMGCPHQAPQGWSRLSVKTCKEPSSTSAQPQTPFLSRAEWNRAVYSLPLPSACFSSYCCLTPSASQINGVYLNTRSDGNLTRFRAKTKVRKVLMREMLPLPHTVTHQLLCTRL